MKQAEDPGNEGMSEASHPASPGFANANNDAKEQGVDKVTENEKETENDTNKVAAKDSTDIASATPTAPAAALPDTATATVTPPPTVEGEPDATRPQSGEKKDEAVKKKKKRRSSTDTATMVQQHTEALEELEQQKEKLEQQREQLERQEEKLQQQEEKLRELGQHQEELGQQKERVAVLDVQAAETAAALKQSEDIAKELGGERDNLKSSQETLQQSLADAGREVQERSSTIEAQQAEICGLRERVAELEKASQDAETTFTETVQTWQQRLQQAESEAEGALASLKQEYKDLEAERTERLQRDRVQLKDALTSSVQEKRILSPEVLETLLADLGFKNQVDMPLGGDNVSRRRLEEALFEGQRTKPGKDELSGQIDQLLANQKPDDLWTQAGVFRRRGERLNESKTLSLYLKQAIMVKDRRMEAKAYRQLAQLFLDLKDYDQCQEWFDRLYRVSELMQDHDGKVRSAIGLGDVLSIQGNHSKASYYFSKAHQLSGLRHSYVKTTHTLPTLSDLTPTIRT